MSKWQKSGLSEECQVRKKVLYYYCMMALKVLMIECF